jgi:hypothetical protein
MPQSGGYSYFAVLHWYFVLYIVFFGIITISKSGESGLDGIKAPRENGAADVGREIRHQGDKR